MSSHAYGSSLVTPSPMSYVINSPVAHAVLKNSMEMSHDNSPEQLNRVEDENRSLHRRVQNKSMENSKLQQRIDRSETELQSYKSMLEQINQAMANGETPCKCTHLTSLLPSRCRTLSRWPLHGPLGAVYLGASGGNVSVSSCLLSVLANRPLPL